MARYGPPQDDGTRLRAYLAKSKEHGLDFAKATHEYGFQPPLGERWWCPAHQRPLTYQEANYDGEGPRCSWCREAPVDGPATELETRRAVRSLPGGDSRNGDWGHHDNAMAVPGCGARDRGEGTPMRRRP